MILRARAPFMDDISFYAGCGAYLFRLKFRWSLPELTATSARCRRRHAYYAAAEIAERPSPS